MSITNLKEPMENKDGKNLSDDTDLIYDLPPQLDRATVQTLCPVVVSSKQKRGCLHCETMIYPPREMCENCTLILQQEMAKKLKQKSQLESLGE